jgi:tRNA A-37 threonylcarbamoyl transferase component Bud32
VTHLLGEGGMGLVFVGRDITLKRDVAIKVLSPALADDSVARVRFTREAEAAAAVSHPNIVGVFQVGDLPHSHIPFFVMQYVEGPTLADAAGRVFPEPRVRRLVAEVASALAAAHRRKLVHRDVKPGNVVLDGETGRALVLDFGISAALTARRRSRGMRLTTEGMYLGTPTYMSPEQAAGEDVTPKSDVYSLGILAYELLTGAPPFAGNALQVMAAQVKQPPPSLVERRPDASEALVSLVARCLAKDPARRPSAEEIVNHLTAEGKHAIEWPPPGLARLRRAGARLAWAMSAMTLTTLAFFGSLALHDAIAVRTHASFITAWSFVLAACVVLLLLFAALTIVRLRLVYRLARAARASGYPWLIVLQVAIDGWPDTGDLMNGMGMFAFVEAETRTRLLAWRRTVAASAAAAFVLAAASALAWAGEGVRWMRGELEPAIAPGVALVVVAPVLLVLGIGCVCLLPEFRLRQREGRGRDRRRTSGAVNAELVRVWLSSVGEAPPPARITRARMFATATVALMLATIAMAAVGIAAVIGAIRVR